MTSRWRHPIIMCINLGLREDKAANKDLGAIRGRMITEDVGVDVIPREKVQSV